MLKPRSTLSDRGGTVRSFGPGRGLSKSNPPNIIPDPGQIVLFVNDPYPQPFPLSEKGGKTPEEPESALKERTTSTRANGPGYH